MRGGAHEGRRQWRQVSRCAIGEVLWFRKYILLRLDASVGSINWLKSEVLRKSPASCYRWTRVLEIFQRDWILMPMAMVT